MVDHTVLMPGVYVSRIDGDIITYDLRMRRPNTEPVLENDSIHTIEHLFATYVRNSQYSDRIIYFGPMGCRTGFYFIVRGMSDAEVLMLVKETVDFIAGYDGEIPGATASECGNYRDHNLQKAKADAKKYAEQLKPISVENMKY
jgi:S-ribosylhomocysteine lyase